MPQLHKPLPAAFGWVGGKSKLARTIVSRLPTHTSYVEVFGGALSVLYAKPPSKIEVVNDINAELINLHTHIKSRPESLANYLRDMLVSRDLFNLIASGQYRPRNDIDRAAAYYYRLALSFGSMGGSFAMPKSRKPKEIWRDFHKWSARLRHVTIEHMSFERLIKEYDRPETLFYCDPPYVGTESYYEIEGGFGLAEHTRLRDLLMGAKGRFVLSYNDCELVRELYRGCEFVAVKVDYTLAGAQKRREAAEVLVMRL